MDIPLLPVAAASVLLFQCVAVAQASPQIPAKTDRTYVLLVPGNGATTLQPVSGIEDIPFDVTCLSFSRISLVHDGANARVYAIDAQLHSRGFSRQADLIELLLGERGVSFQGTWGKLPSETEASRVYKSHYFGQSRAFELDMAHQIMINDQRRLFQDQLRGSSRSLAPRTR